MDNIIDDIINTINNSDWSLNKKIRYAYLELGKNIHKNVEFFYTLFNKITAGKYSSVEIKDIYARELSTDSVICRDVVLMLKKIFDSCGIDSDIRRFCKKQEFIVDDENIEIQHYIIFVKGDDDKNYFLTLVPDLANIQLGFKTEHFANNIEYTDEFGKHIYEGERIEHSIMPFDEIKQIDKELGFLSLKLDDNESLEYMDEVFNILKPMLALNNISPLIRNENNSFYMNLVKLLNNLSGNYDTSSLSCELSKITDDGWNVIKNYVFNCVLKMMQEKYNFEVDSQEYDSLENHVNNNEYDLFFKELKKCVGNVTDKSEGLFNINAIAYNLYSMLVTIDDFKNTTNYKTDEFLALKRKFNSLIDKLGILFVNRESFYVTNKEFSNIYIINKLKYYMPLIFDFGQKTKFSTMEIGEQVVILDRVLQLLLAELRTDKLIPRTQSEFLNNRTCRTVIKDKETEKYLYMILIHGAGKYGNKVLIYDFDLNIIKGFDENISFFEFANNDRYEILSDQIYIEVEKMEEYRKKNASR